MRHYYEGHTRVLAPSIRKTFPEIPENALLRELLASVRNSQFCVQFGKKGGLLYPMDFNFRLGIVAKAIEQALRPIEFETSIKHQLDLPYEELDLTDAWDVIFDVTSNTFIYEGITYDMSNKPPPGAMVSV